MAADLDLVRPRELTGYMKFSLECGRRRGERFPPLRPH